MSEAPRADLKAGPDPKNGLVSVVITGQDPDYSAPWSKQRAWKRQINGLVVPGRRILVHGRRLAHRTLVMVQKLGQAKRYEAKVIEVDYEVPFGLLEVEDPAFWDGLEPLPIADEVPVEGDVTICRWLDSGQFEEARAVIKQLRVDDHFPGEVQFLTLELSSSITSAGWGEIALRDGQVVGITTSSSDDLLPTLAGPVLRQFLDEVDEGAYRGFARHGFTWQQLGNPALRKQLGLKSGEGGIRIREILPHGSATGALEPGDVLLQLDGHRIDERGKFDHPLYGKLFFGVLFTDGRSPGDVIEAVLSRDGARKKVPMTLQAVPTQRDVVPRYTFDQAPEYLEVGGLVFQPVTVDYLRQWRSWWENAPLRILVAQHARSRGEVQDGDRLVVLARVLPDPINLGYHDLRAVLVSKVNGKAIRSMNDLREAVKAPQGGFHIVEMLPGQNAARVVIDAKEAAAARARIHKRYGLGAPDQGAAN